MDDLFLHLVNLDESFWRISRDELVLKWVAGGPVLDVGCGVGGTTKSLLHNGFDTYSIDSSKKACDLVSKINSQTTCVDITAVDERKFPKFKTIILLDVLEHIQDDKKALESVYALLARGGRVIISVPYHNLLWNKTDKYHYRRYSRRQLKKMLEETGFTIKGMRFWNMLSLAPLLLSKACGFEVSHKKIAHSSLNSVLKWYFLRFENRLRVPVGSQLFCLAEKSH